jgi:hypothetical protein
MFVMGNALAFWSAASTLRIKKSLLDGASFQKQFAK